MSGWAPSKLLSGCDDFVTPNHHRKLLMSPFLCPKMVKQRSQIYLSHNKEFRETDVNMKERRSEVEAALEKLFI